MISHAHDPELVALGWKLLRLALPFLMLLLLAVLWTGKGII